MADARADLESGAAAQARLLGQGLAELGRLLGGLEIRDHATGVPEASRGTASSDGSGGNRLIRVGDPVSGVVSGPVLAQARQRVSPAYLKDSMRPQTEFMRRLTPDASVLVVGRWLSPRVRALLDEWGYGYLDLTGNVSLRLDAPVVRLRLDGAARDPEPGPQQGPRRLRGLRAGRLVRLLVDVSPPYTVGELAERTQLSLPYVSRLLQGMSEQGLLTRRGRLVDEVDWVGLLRARAEEHPFSKAGFMVGYAAPRGLGSVLDNLRELKEPPAGGPRIAVTGPVAAAAVAPVAVGGQLMLYVEPQEDGDALTFRNLHRALGLLPQPEGPQVLLVSAEDPVVFTGTRQVDGLAHVALSQLVVDSLSGPGRGPQEGEELLSYMNTTPGWRLASPSQWRLSPRAHE